MTESVQQARERGLRRLALYKSLGHDRQAAVRFIVDQVEPIEGQVLDVGTGHGLLAIEFARRGADVVSVDVSDVEQQVGKANAEHEGMTAAIRFIVADAGRLPCTDGTFGVVANLDALHHFADGPAVLSEMLRVVKPSGRVLVAEFTAEGFALVARVHAAEGGSHAVGPVTVAHAVEWFQRHGLRLATRRENHFHSITVFERSA